MVRCCAAIVALLIGFVFLPSLIGRAELLHYDSSGNMVRLPGHVLPALQKATLLPNGSYDDAQPITVTITLKRSDQQAFKRYLHDVYDPHSPRFRHFLNQHQIAERFGPTPENYARVLNYLRANGFGLVVGSANRLTLTVRAPRAVVARIFAVRIQDYRIGNRDFYANTQDPAIPTDIAPIVQAVTGLSDLAKPAATKNIIQAYSNLFMCLNAATGTSTSKPTEAKCWSKFWGDLGKALTLNSVSSSSDPPPGSWVTFDGTGQTVGLLEFDTFQTSDVSDYLNLIGAPASRIGNLSQVDVSGGATPGSNQDEVLIDILAVLNVAPGAKVVVYDGPFAGPGVSFQTLFNKMINDGVTVISNSWAYCENQTDLADVSSIDSILASAAASGISVFNGAGDSGSTCLDGSSNTVAVPADSPNATAVGGSSLISGPGLTYNSETWWDGSKNTPPSGQGGFGVSKFFSRPVYQDALNPFATMRSVPDVVAEADPENGIVICQASAGGCPTNLLYGGTSNAAPLWAAFAALLNQAQGHNLGAFNPLIYPLANTSAFHSAASMGSDFSHVGLGSPNLNALHLKLNGQAAGLPSAATSEVGYYAANGMPGETTPVAADGTSKSFVVVRLRDAATNTVAGKTITLTASPAGNAIINPSSGVSSLANGAVVFTITDIQPETVTFTATDTTDGIKPTQTASIPFVTPPATGAGLDVFPASVAADGKSNAVIVVTLKDKLGRPNPGKLVQISQGPGHSVIKGPIPAITDASGQIQFTAVDQMAETITYSAVDITDGNIPFPTTGSVAFTGGPANGCGNSATPAAPGFQVTPYATGFIAQNFFFGNVNFGGCPGAYGLAFDATGNLYVSDSPTGDIYKIPPGGGVADASTLITATALGPSLAGLASDDKGNLFASRDATTGNFTTGAIFKIDPSNGTILQTVASDLTCPTALAVDPLSGDLFTDDSCSGAGSDNPDLWRISGQDTATPKTDVYTTLPGTPNANISFASSGTIYAWAFTGLGTGVPRVAQISGTNGPATPTVSLLPNLQLAALGVLANGAQANGDAQTLFLNPFDADSNTSLGIGTTDLTTSPPSAGVILATTNGANNLVRGPDGCVYAAQGDGVFKITDAKGTCNYAAPTQPPALVLAPPAISPNPAQGELQTFGASFHYTKAPLGTPVLFQVAGANPQVKLVLSDANGKASFSYAGVFTGIDTITATATLGTTTLSSNQSVIAWTTGQHTSFLTLNLSPTAVMAGKPVTLVASLSDVSVTPSAPVAGASVQIALEGNSCFGTTNAQGNASCTLTPTIAQLTSQTASFTGNSTLLAAIAAQAFNVTGPPTVIPTFTPAPTRTPSPTPSVIIVTRTPTPAPTGTTRPTPKLTPTPTATPRECIASTPRPTIPIPTPTPVPGHPVITGVTNPVLVGSSFVINGKDFSLLPVINFFVATAKGPVNEGPLKASSISPTQLVVPVPTNASQGDGFVSVQVINTDKAFAESNLGYALLQGSAAAGLPSITGLNGHGLAPTSIDPNFATANVETALTQGSAVTINGNGFDTKNGVAIDVFCACPGGKLTTTFLNPGNPNLRSSSIIFTLPAATPTGPGSIVVSNAGAGAPKLYAARSEAVSVPIGARILVTNVTQAGSTLTVDGAGFSTRTVINFFNTQAGNIVNLGGLTATGASKIPITLVNSTRITFSVPSGAKAGPAFVQALNPPFVPFTSSGNDPCGAFPLQ